METLKLAGIDVGFSAVRASTGLAFLDGERLWVNRVTSSTEDRRRQVVEGFKPLVTAFDGPIASETVKRKCEYMFSKMPFNKRCKPGLSHFGTGLKLRQATAKTIGDFTSFFPEPTVIVEAFPNLFLGVLVPEEVYLQQPKLIRGKRFDWLYDEVTSREIAEGKFKQVLPQVFWDRWKVEKDHEQRAALVCLLTAALHHYGLDYLAGDEEGGYFCLPRTDFWADWAVKGLAALTEVNPRGYNPEI
jgi:hypothetical protein